MRRVIALAITGLSLAACSSTPPRQPAMQVDLESTPPGADARLSTGQSCTTPCSVNIPVPETDFSVSFSLNDFKPVTVPVRVSGKRGWFSCGWDDADRAQSRGRATRACRATRRSRNQRASRRGQRSRKTPPEHHRARLLQPARRAHDVSEKRVADGAAKNTRRKTPPLSACAKKRYLTVGHHELIGTP